MGKMQRIGNREDKDVFTLINNIVIQNIWIE
jgi:hypothetical protein